MVAAILPFELWRQDDNGNRLLVCRCRTLAEAEARLAELTRVPHKQIYWIVATAATDEEQANG